MTFLSRRRTFRVLSFIRIRRTTVLQALVFANIHDTCITCDVIFREVERLDHAILENQNNLALMGRRAFLISDQGYYRLKIKQNEMGWTILFFHRKKL